LILSFNLKLPKIIFGVNTVGRIRDEAERLGGKKLLIVTDEVIEKTGLLEKVTDPLEKGSFEISIYKTEPEPKVEIAENIVETVRRGMFDLIVGVGGGSCMDMAKIASIISTNPGNVEQYIGINLVKKPGLPKILIPTTAGTGSEVTPNAILAIPDMGKVGIVTEYNVADVAIVDPQMTMTMPSRLTATTGLDALSHAIESYISVKSNPLTDALALEAIRLISTNLYSAFVDGKDIDARSLMSMAALLAGITISVAGTCAGHAAAYAFAVKYKLSHGLSCAISLPYIIKYNAVACLPKIINVAHAMDEKISNPTLEEATEKVVCSIINMMKKLKVPYRLKDVNVPIEDIPNLAKIMVKNIRLLINNPIKITEEDALKIFKDMWEGKIDNVKS